MVDRCGATCANLFDAAWGSDAGVLHIRNLLHDMDADYIWGVSHVRRGFRIRLAQELMRCADGPVAPASLDRPRLEWENRREAAIDVTFQAELVYASVGAYGVPRHLGP